MTISASQIVKVIPRVINAGGSELEISGLILTTNQLAIYPGTVSFTSATAVGGYFGTNSAEYEVAVKYFLGYNNSFSKPKKIHFARWVQSAIAGSLIGGTVADVATLKGLNGTITINVDGSDVTTTSLDFSNATTQSDIAQILSNALNGASVAYNSNLNAFVVTSNTSGANSAIGYASGNIADSLGLSENAGAVISKGSNALSVPENMNSITNVTQNWVSFTTITEPTDETALALAKWANDSNGEYLYSCYTSNKANLNPNAGTSLVKSMADFDYEGVIVTYGSVIDAVFVMSIAASIDWNRNNGLVTWAFKSQSGLLPTVTNDITASNAVQLKVNYYGKWATRNDDFQYHYQGAMIGGQFGFVDGYVGNLWLRNVLQVAIMNGLNQIGRVPYTDEGYTIIRAWCSDPINRALRNGVIDPGVSLSEAQKAQLFNEIGQDVASEIFTNGYYLMVEDPGANARVNRDTPTLGIWYTYGGSVHRVELPVTAVL